MRVAPSLMCDCNDGTTTIYVTQTFWVVATCKTKLIMISSLLQNIVVSD